MGGGSGSGSGEGGAGGMGGRGGEWGGGEGRGGVTLYTSWSVSFRSHILDGNAKSLLDGINHDRIKIIRPKRCVDLSTLTLVLLLL